MPAKQPHDQLVTWLVIAALAAGASAMWWWDEHLPAAVTAVLNPAVVLGPSYLMARWKRAWYAWTAFWVLAALQAASAVLQLTGGLGTYPGPSAAAGTLALGAFLALMKMPRRQPPAPPETAHVVHHHVLYGPDGRAVEVAAPAWAHSLHQADRQQAAAITEGKRDGQEQARRRQAGDQGGHEVLQPAQIGIQGADRPQWRPRDDRGRQAR